MNSATKKIIRDYTTTIITAVGFAILIRTFLLETYRIPNQSMKPALLAGDTLFVVKWPQSMNKNTLPQRGDIVVFRQFTHSSSARRDYIRRVVGLPGDTIALKNGNLLLNATPVRIPDTKTLNAPCFQERLSRDVEYQICSESSFIQNFGPVKIPNDSVFVIEDARAQKEQQKGWGIIPLSSIQGKAQWIWLSLEPHDMVSTVQNKSKWLPHFRFERMFRRIE